MTQVHPQVLCCALCGIIQEPLPEEVELHPAIATPLDQLEAVTGYLGYALSRSVSPNNGRRREMMVSFKGDHFPKDITLVGIA